MVEGIPEIATGTPAFIGTLGLNWKLFLAQLVNFSVVVFVLWKWAYKPLVKLMDERSAKIEKSLEDARRIEREMKAMEETRAATLLQTKKEAQKILADTQSAAERERVALVAKTKEETEKILANAKLTIAREKEQMFTEAKAHLGELVVTAAEKILREKIDTKKDKELVEAAIKGL